MGQSAIKGDYIMLKSIKRIFGIVLAIIMLLAFSACAGNGDTAAQPMELEPAQETNNSTNSMQESGEEAEPVEIIPIHADSWQEAYAEALRFYATGQNLREWEVGWRFILHDINQDGIPELFLVAESMTGHVEHRYVYTFVDGTLISLEYESFVTDGGVFAPIDDSPWVVFFYPAGSGGWYRKRGIEGNALSEIASGFFTLSEAGHEIFFEYGEVSGYEWYNLTMNDESVTVNEFESIFGVWGQRRWLRSVPITEDNIRDGVIEWNPNTRLFNLMGVSGEWVTATSELISGLSINIPADWQAYDYNHANDPFSSFIVYGEGIGSHIRFVIGESPIANPAQIVDGFQYSGQFHFNDGHIGYMLENEDGISWLYIEEGILGAILSISLRHDGIRTIYTDNEELILRIVRSIALTP